VNRDADWIHALSVAVGRRSLFARRRPRRRHVLRDVKPAWWSILAGAVAGAMVFMGSLSWLEPSPLRTVGVLLALALAGRAAIGALTRLAAWADEPPLGCDQADPPT
jgi:CHASE2 domain-containing sensor protein